MTLKEELRRDFLAKQCTRQQENADFVAQQASKWTESLTKLLRDAAKEAEGLISCCLQPFNNQTTLFRYLYRLTADEVAKYFREQELQVQTFETVVHDKLYMNFKISGWADE